MPYKDYIDGMIDMILYVKARLMEEKVYHGRVKKVIEEIEVAVLNRKFYELEKYLVILPRWRRN